MDSEVQRMYDRIRLYYLMKQQPIWSAESYARVIGRTPQWVRKWKKRFDEDESGTLAKFMSRSRAPHTRPRQTPEQVKKVIGDLREELSEKYHRKAGARLIQIELQRYQELVDQGFFVPQSPSTIHRVLHELGYIDKPREHHRLPVELPEPNEEWEMDFGEIRIDEEVSLEFFVVVDRGTSRVIYVEGSMGYNAEMALQAVARLLLLHGLPQRLRFDRDSRFVGAWTRDSYPSALIRFLRVIGVEPIVCPPRRPDLKPFVERTIGTLQHEWLDRFSLNSYADAMDVLPDFVFYFNDERIHFGRACNGKTPNAAFPSLPPLPHLPQQVDPDDWLRAYHQRVFRRRISSNGTIQIDQHVYYIGSRHAGKRVLAYLDAIQRRFYILHDDKVLAVKDIQGLLGQSLDFQSFLTHMKQEARTIEMHRLLSWYGVGEVD